jgi:hypothetical protein
MAEEEAKESIMQPKDESSSDWENHMNVAFASLGGFEMQEDGLVVKTGDCKQLRKPFRSRRRRKTNFPGSKQ